MELSAILPLSVFKALISWIEFLTTGAIIYKSYILGLFSLLGVREWLARLRSNKAVQEGKLGDVVNFSLNYIGSRSKKLCFRTIHERKMASIFLNATPMIDSVRTAQRCTTMRQCVLVDPDRCAHRYHLCAAG